jgi:hypothetical protein
VARGLGIPRKRVPLSSFGEAEGFSLSLAKQALNGKPDDAVQTVKRNLHLA